MEPKDLVLQYLDEAHATETALVTTLRAHSAMAPEGAYRNLLERHMQETVEQVENIDKRRSELAQGDGGRGVVGTGAGLVRDVIGQALVLTKGPIDAVRARGSAERMLKNAKDECATEALEIATYDSLEAAALAAGDQKTAKLARDHRATEERMLKNLRKHIPKLAVAAIDERTEGADTSVATRSGSSTRSSSSRSRGATKSSSSSGRSSRSSGSGSSSKSSGSASKSSGSASKSSGSASKSSGSASKSSGSASKSCGSASKSSGSASKSSGSSSKSSGSSSKSSGSSSKSKSSGSASKTSGSSSKSKSTGSSSKSSGSSSKSNGSSGSRSTAKAGSGSSSS